MRPLRLLCLTASLAGCATAPPAAAPKAGEPARAPAAAPQRDPLAQKRAYDRGVIAFSEQEYLKARSAWEEAVRLGPGTPLGVKAQQNLRKVHELLKAGPEPR